MFSRKPKAKAEIRTNKDLSRATKAYFEAMSDAGYKVCCVGMIKPLDSDNETGFGVMWSPQLRYGGLHGDKMAQEIISEVVQTIMGSAKVMTGVAIPGAPDLGEPDIVTDLPLAS